MGLGIYIMKNLSESEVKEKGYERILPKYLKVGKEDRNERNEPSDFHEYAEDIIRLFNDKIEIDADVDDDEEVTEDNPQRLDSQETMVEENNIEILDKSKHAFSNVVESSKEDP